MTIRSLIIFLSTERLYCRTERSISATGPLSTLDFFVASLGFFFRHPFLRGYIDFIRFTRRLLEVSDCLADSFAHLRQLVRAKKNYDDDENNEKFRHS